VAYHGRAFREAKRFVRWLQAQGRLPADPDPFEGLRVRGRANKGKPQLSLDEARRWRQAALALIWGPRGPQPQDPQDRPVPLSEWGGSEGALAALTALLLGLRQSEVTLRVVRDLDNGGAWLRIDDGKTPQSRGTMEVPFDLRFLLRCQAAGKEPLAPLFGEEKPRGKKWINRWTKTVCRKAGVGLDEQGQVSICAHSLRGMFGSIGVKSGLAADAVAAALRHDEATSRAHYIDPAALHSAQQRRLTELLSAPDAKAGGEYDRLLAQRQEALNALARLEAQLAELKAKGADDGPDARDAR